MKQSEISSAISLLRKHISNSEAHSFLSLLNSLPIKKCFPKNIYALHDTLLFAIAYAPSLEVKTKSEETLKNLYESAVKKSDQLQDSGISGSAVISSFTLSLLKWITKKYPKNISFHSFDKVEDDIGEPLKLIFPTAEAEILSNGWNKNKLFKELCGGKISLGKIIEMFSFGENEKLNEFAFSQLGLYVQIQFSENVICRTNSRSVSYPDFFHAEILKKSEPEKIISSVLPKQKKLSAHEKQLLVDNSRMMLAALGRETDPVTFASVEETEFVILERGFSIALFSLHSKNRLAFDSYIGYMMFKNGLPIAYGGAWIFFHRALIGINIFDAYRGGESSFLFSQLLRVYHQRYKVNRFSVEPYQYGKNNPEGISSGAYWFYYRFGFRSDNEQLKKIAEEENEKIKSEKGYRSSSSTLKQFTNSNISLILDSNFHGPDSGKMSLALSKYVSSRFNGNRTEAIASGLKKIEFLIGKKYFNQLLKSEEVLQNWSLVFLLLDKSFKFNGKEKISFVKMILEKSSGSESLSVIHQQKLKRFFLSL